jgi:hypothetical protein
MESTPRILKACRPASSLSRYPSSPSKVADRG